MVGSRSFSGVRTSLRDSIPFLLTQQPTHEIVTENTAPRIKTAYFTAVVAYEMSGSRDVLKKRKRNKMNSIIWIFIRQK